MTREIKFRAKVKHHNPMTNPENGWVEGYYLQDLTQGEMRSYIFNCPCYWEVLPETVGQFTGLLDKNGKEIYFDDIVKNKHGDIGCIVWYDNSIRTDWGGDEIHYIELEDDIEVIGNVFDNPELLKTETL